MSYAGMGEPVRSLQSYQHALRLAPEYLPALEGAAQLEYASHDARTGDMLSRVLKLRPADQTAHAMFGVLAFRKGDCAASAGHFSQAKQAIDTQPEALTEFSSCLVKLSRFQEAVPVFERLLRLAPENNAVRHNLALAEWNEGRAAEALATLQPALAAEHPAGDDLTLAAEIAESQADTKGALELLRRAVLLDPRNKDAYLDFANLSYQHASIQVGLDMLNIGLQQLPEEAVLYFARGVLLCQLGQMDAGLADLDNANRLDPKFSLIGVAQGIARSQIHDAPGALARFRQQVKEHPDDPLAQYLLAEALSELGRPEGSPEFREEVAAAQAAIRLDPKKIEVHDLLASAYLQAGKIAQSIGESRAALAVNPKDQQALYHLVLALKRTDHREEIPGLLTRLMQAREEAQIQTQQNKKHKLVEVTAGLGADPS